LPRRGLLSWEIGEHIALLRRILLRMRSWQNSVFTEGHSAMSVSTIEEAFVPDGKSWRPDLSADAAPPRSRVAKLSLFFWLLLAPVCWNTNAIAADIEGVWASHASECDKVFVKGGKGVVFAKDADLYGSGFIIEGRKIRGKIATCDIKTIKEDGSTVHLITVCATDVMLSNVQFSLRTIDRDKIVRIFPGVPEMDTPYERCPSR
jgi:hypothetical protein